MSSNSKIEWTDSTWNTISGCSHAGSPGCDNCYARKMTKRLNAMGIEKYRHGFGKVVCHDDRDLLLKPTKWRNGRRVFVNSMSDTFHDDVDFLFLDKLFAVMAFCVNHTFIILTKRPYRMKVYLDRLGRKFEILERSWIELGLGLSFEGLPLVRWPIPNIWVGVTVENQMEADSRIPALLKCNAVKRIVSCEPLLGAVDFSIIQDAIWHDCEGAYYYDALRGSSWWSNGEHIFGGGPKLDWVICGAESGIGKRLMDIDLARSLRDQCKKASVPFFFKKNSSGNRLLDGEVYEEFPG